MVFPFYFSRIFGAGVLLFLDSGLLAVQGWLFNRRIVNLNISAMVFLELGILDLYGDSPM